MAAEAAHDSILISSSSTEETRKASVGPSNGPLSNLQHQKWRIERSNLLNIAKICVKMLIEASLSAGGTSRVLTEECSVLEQFFVVMEHILRHGLKGL